MEEQRYVARINENAANFLFGASKWIMVQVIVGYLMSGIITIIAAGLILGASVFSAFSKMAPAPIWVIGILYLAIATFYFFLSYKLHGFSRNAKLGLTTNNDLLIERSFKNLNIYSKIIGIAILVMLIVYPIIILGVILAAI